MRRRPDPRGPGRAQGGCGEAPAGAGHGRAHSSGALDERGMELTSCQETMITTAHRPFATPGCSLTWAEAPAVLAGPADRPAALPAP